MLVPSLQLNAVVSVTHADLMQHFALTFTWRCTALTAFDLQREEKLSGLLKRQ